jgi:hypothetical protein
MTVYGRPHLMAATRRNPQLFRIVRFRRADRYVNNPCRARGGSRGAVLLFVHGPSRDFAQYAAAQTPRRRHPNLPDLFAGDQPVLQQVICLPFAATDLGTNGLGTPKRAIEVNRVIYN